MQRATVAIPATAGSEVYLVRGPPVAADTGGNPIRTRLHLIGQMEAWTLAGESILPTGRKTRGLLAIAALSAPRPVLRARLAAMLWSRRPEEQARASLRQEIHRLTEAMAPVAGQVLVLNRDHLSLRASAVWTDLNEALQASPTRPAAISLLDGKLLEDLDGIDPAFDAWLAIERERLTNRARALAEHLLQATYEPISTMAAARQLLAIDRTHEGAWRALMRAHAASGERGHALQAYGRCRAALADQLDASPSEATQIVAAEIRSAPSGSNAATDGALAGVALSGRPSWTSVWREAGPTPLRVASHAEAPPRPRYAPRVGLLPFQALCAGAAGSQLVAVLANETAAALARFRWISVVPAASLARVAEETCDAAAAGRGVGIDFLLEGTVQGSPQRLRVAVRLIDLRAGEQVVWSRRFDGDAADLLTVQDDISGETAAQVDGQIRVIEAQRAAVAPAAHEDAYDLTMRAVPLLSRIDRAEFLQAGDLLRRGTAREPANAGAHIWLADWNIILLRHGWATDPAAAVAEAGRLANRAVELDPRRARAFAIAGDVRAALYRRPQEALLLHDRALQINPNLGMAWALSAAAHVSLGDFAEAERRMRRYKTLLPADALACFYDVTFVMLALLRHDHEGAATLGRVLCDMNAGYSAAYQPYLAALGHLGQHSQAAQVRRQMLATDPSFTIARFVASSPLTRPDNDHVVAGLRLAQVSEA